MQQMYLKSGILILVVVQLLVFHQETQMQMDMDRLNMIQVQEHLIVQVKIFLRYVRRIWEVMEVKWQLIQQ